VSAKKASSGARAQEACGEGINADGSGKDKDLGFKKTLFLDVKAYSEKEGFSAKIDASTKEFVVERKRIRKERGKDSEGKPFGKPGTSGIRLSWIVWIGSTGAKLRRSRTTR